MTRTTAGWFLVILAACCPAAAVAQEPEIIVLDPNHPIIQKPGTVQPQPGVLAPAGTPAPEAPEVVPLPAQGVNAREILAGLWFRYDALVQKGDADQAARQVTIAQEFMKREGLRSSPEIASALLAQARRGLDGGDYRRAKEAYRLAARFGPDLPAAHFGLAAALLWGDRDPLGAASEWWAGLRDVVTGPDSLYNLAGNGLLVIFLGAGIGALGALLLLSLKHTPGFFHDLQERSSSRLSEDGARLAGWGMLALPLVVPIALVWVVAAWGALFFAYFRGTERIVAVLALLILVASGPVTEIVAWHFGTAADPGARALIRSVRQGPDLQDEQTLKRLAADHPGEALFPFLLASAYRMAGRFDEATSLYRHVLEIDPGNARAMVNLGNLHALRQEFSLAQTFYRKAIEADPRLALAHYDSHLAHLEAFHLEAADAELKEARLIDDALVTGLLGEGNEGRSKRTPQDTGYGAREIWTRAFRLRLEGGMKSKVVDAITAPATLAGACGLLAALILPGVGVAPRTFAARRCRRCGRPYCRRCQVTTKHPDVCSQCMHLFILRDGLAPGVKGRKLEEVARYRRRVFVGTRLLSIILPGGGHVLGGRALLGSALLAGWAIAWLGLVLRGRLMVTPEAITAAAAWEMVLPLAVLAFLTWLWGNLSSHEPAAE